MAEERVIDDDLDRNRKYKIRKNADGEDELYIDDTVEEEEDFEAVSFNVPEFAEGGEEGLTPEQIAAAEQEKKERIERIKGALSVNIEKAQAKLAESDFDGVVEFADKALQLDPSNGAAWALRLRGLTKDFTDFEQIDESVDTAENISKYCTAEYKMDLIERTGPMVERTDKLEEQAAALHVEVEEKKAERREVFAEDKRKAVRWFSITAVPFLVLLILAISFSTIMFANKYGVYLVLTIVLAALTVVAFVATLFTLHKLWDAMKKVSLNEKNSSTEIGRNYENMLSEISKLKAILHSFYDREDLPVD